MRSGASFDGKPEVSIDRAWEWVLQQACQEARQDCKKVRVEVSKEAASMEVHTTSTALAAFFGIVSAVLSMVSGSLWRLLRRERSQHRTDLLAIGQNLDRTVSAVNPGLSSPDGRAIPLPPPPPVRTLPVRPLSRTTPTAPTSNIYTDC